MMHPWSTVLYDHRTELQAMKCVWLREPDCRTVCELVPVLMRMDMRLRSGLLSMGADTCKDDAPCSWSDNAAHSCMHVPAHRRLVTTAMTSPSVTGPVKPAPVPARRSTDPPCPAGSARAGGRSGRPRSNLLPTASAENIMSGHQLSNQDSTMNT